MVLKSSKSSCPNLKNQQNTYQILTLKNLLNSFHCPTKILMLVKNNLSKLITPGFLEYAIH
mgnify:CR=1 FL=1